MLILASASPRRQELLKKITEDFLCKPSDIEENYPQNMPITAVPEFLALKKAEHIAKSYPEDTIIGSDTGVFCYGKMMGKPADRDEAYIMLKSLSGKTHSVITGCAIVKGDKKITFSCETKVSFYELSDDEINCYIDTGECYDKAGGYGIQGLGALLIKRIEGDYSNVVGLPVAELYRKLAEI